MTLTASRIELAERCEGHLTLPHRDSPNEWSDAGTERHAVDEAAINSGDVPEAYLERWPGLTWRSEVRYRYDVSDGTARFCGVGSNRDYGPASPVVVGGSVDVEGRGPGVLVVVDKKSFEAVTPAVRNPQVRFLALAAARVQPAERIFVAINHELTGLDVAEIDPLFDIDVIAHDTRALLIRSAAIRAEARAGRIPAFNTGRWCRWCPAFDSCPKQGELRALVQLDDENPELAMRLVLDDESAPDVYELYKRIGILHKRIGQSLHAYAASTPIRLPNGKVFGKHDKLGNEKLDGDVVYQVVKDKHGQAMADGAVIRSATKARLEEALKGKRGAVKTVLDEVRALGGATRKAGSTIEEYEPGPRLVTDDAPKQLAAVVADSPF